MAGRKDVNAVWEAAGQLRSIGVTCVELGVKGPPRVPFHWLYVPGTETLPIAIYSFIDNGTFEIAAALSVVLILLSIAAMLALRWLTGKAQMEL